MAISSTSRLSHFLQPVNGPWSPETGISYRAPLAATLRAGIGNIVAGRVGHLKLDGSTPVFTTGVGDVAMSLFVFTFDSQYVDASGGGAPGSNPDAYVGATGNSVITMIPGSAGHELCSSEFDAAQTYTPDTALTATADDTNATTGGRLTPGVPYSKTICGIVSSGVGPGGYKAPQDVLTNPSAASRNGLYFWAFHLPRLKKATVTDGALSGTLLT